jgi:phenylacetate-CoA ligase
MASEKPDAGKTSRPGRLPSQGQKITVRNAGPPVSLEALQTFSPGIVSEQTQQIYAIAHHFSLSEWWPEDRLSAMQLAFVGDLLKHAHETVPFQQPRLAPVIAQMKNGFDATLLADLPIMTRAVVQEAAGGLVARRLPAGHGKRREVKTTGSTGQPVRAQITRLADLYNSATTLRGHSWFRRDLMGRNVSILVTADGRERRALRAWCPGRSGPGFVYSNGVPVERLLEMLLADDPDYLQCHPSMLQELIHHSIGSGRKPQRLREVRSLGEILEPGVRALCQRHWGIPVRDNYSSEEFGTLALQCPEHDHLHVMSERVLIEILDDDDRPCEPGQVGRVIVTGLLGYATPLIRYELGDRAIAGEPCPCGRGLPVIEKVIGRERHSVTLPSGERIFPVLDAEPLLLKTGVRQYQLVQSSPETIDLNIVCARQLTKDEEAAITAHFQQNFHYPFEFSFNYVDRIERGPGGKFQIFKSELG